MSTQDGVPQRALGRPQLVSGMAWRSVGALRLGREGRSRSAQYAALVTSVEQINSTKRMAHGIALCILAGDSFQNQFEVRIPLYGKAVYRCV